MIVKRIIRFTLYQISKQEHLLQNHKFLYFKLHSHIRYAGQRAIMTPEGNIHVIRDEQQKYFRNHRPDREVECHYLVDLSKMSEPIKMVPRPLPEPTQQQREDFLRSLAPAQSHGLAYKIHNQTKQI